MAANPRDTDKPDLAIQHNSTSFTSQPSLIKLWSTVFILATWNLALKSNMAAEPRDLHRFFLHHNA